MTQEKPRIQRVLTYLSEAEKLARPKEIGDTIGESALNVGKDLHELKGRGWAQTEGEGQWKITPEGTESIIEADKRKETLIQTETRTKDRTKRNHRNCSFRSRRFQIH